MAAPPVPALIQITPATDTLVALGATRQLAAIAKDASGNTLLGQTFVWRSSQPGVLRVDSTSGLVTAVANGSATVTASIGAVQGSAGIAVAQAVTTVTVTPAAATFSALGDTARFTAVAKDSLGATVAGVRFLWLSSVPGVATLDTAGLATARGAGQATVTAAGRGIPGYGSLAVTQTAQQLAFSEQPTDVVAGAAISPAIQVEVRDANGALVLTARQAVTIALGANPGSGTPAGSRTVNAVGGVATFSGLWIDKAASGYTLAASASGLTGGTSVAFAVSAGPATRLAFAAPPSSGEANLPMSAVQVAVQDAFGNAVAAAGSVTVSLAASPWPNAALGGTLAQALSGGSAAFNDLRVSRPGAGYRLRATQGALSAESDTFSVHLTFASVVAGSDHTCGLASGGAFCWGSNRVGQLGADPNISLADSVPGPVPGTFVQLEAGGSHTCGLTGTGAVYCWGENVYGQLGDGTNTNHVSPTLVSGSGTSLVFASISAWGIVTCGLVLDGTPYCWGYNQNYNLGDSTAINRNTPTLVKGGLQFTQISVGAFHTCGLAAGGVAYCWGGNGSGEVGDSTTTPRPVPVQVAGSGTGSRIFASLSAGTLFTCGVNNVGAALCWGDNTSDQLGRTTGETKVPGLVSGGITWLGVSAGAFHACGAAADGRALCWGSNSQGQLGMDNPNFVSYPSPTQVVSRVPGFVFSSVTTGVRHSCAFDASVNAETRVICWGGNGYGQMGNGETALRRDYGLPVIH